MHIIAAEKHGNFISHHYGDCGQDFIVSIAIHYLLDRPRIESRCGQFNVRSRPVMVPTQPPVQWVRELFSWDKVAGALCKSSTCI